MPIRKLSRAFLFPVTVSVALISVFAGCGGSGGTPVSPGGTAVGSVTVPNTAGRALAVSTALGAKTVDGGSFDLPVGDSALNLVSVLDSETSRVVLFGMAEPSVRPVKIDPSNCAASLVFLGLGASDLNGTQRADLWESIKKHSTTAALATAIETAMQTNLFALEDGNESIQTALAAALAAQVASLPVRTEAPALGSRETPSPSLTLTKDENNGPHKGQVSSRQAQGFIIDNYWSRLEGSCFVYKTGYTDKEGTQHTTNPERFGSEYTFLAETTTSPIALALDPAFSAENFEMVVLQPVFGQAAPAVFGQSSYAGETATWRASLAKMYRRGLMKVSAAQMLDAIGAPQVDMTAENLDQAANLFAAINADTTGIFAAAQEGPELSGLVAQCASIPAKSEADAFSTLAALAPILQTQAPELAQKFASKSLTSMQIQAFRGTMKIVAALGSWEFSATTGRYAKEYSMGNAANLSAGKFGVSAFEVTPPSGSFDAGQSMKIEVQYDKDVYPGDVTFEYSLSTLPGSITNAVLNDAQGKVGREITTTSPTCYLVTGQDSVGLADVEVTMILKDKDGVESFYKQTRRYSPNGHTEFSVMKATPGTFGADFYDIASATRIEKPNASNGVYPPMKVELWADVRGNSIQYTPGNRYVYWNLPAYSKAPIPSTVSWDIVGQTVRANSSGTSSMGFGIYDYGDHILIVNWRGGGRNDDPAYEGTITAFMHEIASAATARYKITPTP